MNVSFSFTDQRCYNLSCQKHLFASLSRIGSQKFQKYILKNRKLINKGILLFFAFTVGLGTTLYVLEVRVYIIAPEKANKQYRQCGNSDNILKVPLLQYNNITLLYELKKLKLRQRHEKAREPNQFEISRYYFDFIYLFFDIFEEEKIS